MGFGDRNTDNHNAIEGKTEEKIDLCKYRQHLEDYCNCE